MHVIGVFVLIIACVSFLPTLEATCFKLGGLLAPVFTPLDEYGSLCLEVIPQYAQYLKDNGVDGVVVAGTSGEGPTLTVSENKMLLDAWMETAPPLGLFVVSTVGAMQLPNSLEMAKYSRKIGVDAIFVLPPVYYDPQTAERLIDHMKLIADCAPDTPLVYDDYPNYTGVNVDMVRFFELATKKIPNFRGVYSHILENLLLLRNKLTGEQKLFAANYIYLATQIFFGFENYVYTSLNFFPRLIIDTIRNGKDRNMTQTINLNQRLNDLMGVITEKGNKIAAQKAAMPMINGVCVGPSRAPNKPMSENEKDDLRRRLKNNNISIVNSGTKC